MSKLFTPPTKIQITSCGDILEFVCNVKNAPEKTYTYKYVKSIEKLNNTVNWTETYLITQLKNYFKSI